MGSRKRKTVVYRPSTAKVFKRFPCPHCGRNTVTVEKINKDKGTATIKCSNCLLEKTYKGGIGSITENIDIYGMFIDDFGDVCTT